MSLHSYLSDSDAPFERETESDKSLVTKSLASHSDINDARSIEINSLVSEEIEFSKSKSSQESSAAKSQSHKGTNSEDITLGTQSQASTGYGGSPLSHSRSRSIPPSRQSSRRLANDMTDFEREFFSEDYMSGDEGDDESFINSLTQKESVESDCIGFEKYKDFLRCLPVHLSKRILGMLDKNSLTNCLCLSKHWRSLAEEVKQDYMVHQLMTEEIMLMQVN